MSSLIKLGWSNGRHLLVQVNGDLWQKGAEAITYRSQQHYNN
jgi:hypothetical protein